MLLRGVVWLGVWSCVWLRGCRWLCVGVSMVVCVAVSGRVVVCVCVRVIVCGRVCRGVCMCVLRLHVSACLCVL